MRVATYSQPAALTRGSLAGLVLLTVTVLLGSTAAAQVLDFAAPALGALLTPAWLLLYAGSIIGLMLGHGINWLSWLVRYRILLVLLMLGTLASIGWALDTRLSFERTVHMLGSTLIAIYIGFTVPLLTTLRIVAVVLGVLFVSSLGVVLALPALGIEDYAGTPVWRGVFNTKNSLGFWSAIGVMLYIALSDSVNTFAARLACFLMAALCMGLLTFSQSATSLVALVLAGALSLYLYIAARSQLGFVRMAVLAALIGGLALFAVSNVPTAELVGRSDDLTGRGEVWAQTWSLIMQRPATGFGYGVLWFPADDTGWIQETLTDFSWTVHHAHNGFLQVASEIGLPLAVVALLMVVQQLVEIFYCQYQRQQAGVLFVLAFSIAYLITNFSEARFLVNRELFWILFIALPISMLRQINVVVPAATGDPGSAPTRAPAPPHGPPARWPAAPSRAARPRSTALQVGPEDRNSSSPWIAAAAAMAARQAAEDAAARAEQEAIERASQVAEEQADAADDTLADGGDLEWTDTDLDATLASLTLADADIDLGERESPRTRPDGLDATLDADASAALDTAAVDEHDHTVDADELLFDESSPSEDDRFDRPFDAEPVVPPR